ncbi:MAG: hypothetical protein RIT81_32285 [Deltaproteobacteria bacterium]
MSTIEPPYLQMSSLRGEPWWVGLDNEDPAPVEETLEGWDSSRVIKATRTVSLDPSRIAEETGLGRGSRLRILSGWACDATRGRSFGAQHDFSIDDTKRELELRFDILGRDVASAVDLETVVVLLERSPNSLETSARIPGSVLWNEAARVHIEGIASRFPMEWVAFADAGFPPRAAWYLDWDPTCPENSVLGGLRLYLNASHPRLSKMLEAEDETTAALLETIQLDIVRQIVAGAFSSYDFTLRQSEFEDGTVGALATRLMRVYYPGYSAQSLKELRLHNLSNFESMLQSTAGFLGGGSW